MLYHFIINCCLDSKDKNYYVLILAPIGFFSGTVLSLCAKCGVEIIYAHLKYLRAYEWKVLVRHEQTDLQFPRFRIFLMTLVSWISVFPILNRSFQTFQPIFK